MEKKLTLAYALAVILALMLVAAILFIIKDHKTIQTLKADAAQNITAQRDVIREDCSASDAGAAKRCADDLQNLSDLLSKFQVTNPTATTTRMKADLNNLKLETLPKQ